MKRDKKRCPRCNRKLDINAPKCDTCGLIFSRLNLATNSAGIKAVKNGDYNKVVYVKKVPQDVSKWKLFFIALFFGFLGVQYYKVGRRKLFYFMISAFVITTIFVTMEFFGVNFDNINKYVQLILYFRYMPGALAFLLWFASALQIAFGFFKYPVSIDERLVIKDVDPNIAKQILDEVKEDRKSNNTENEV